MPLWLQLCDALRQAILREELRPGSRLPSTRILASDFGVSRNTVVSAYDQLRAEGYLDARVGAGTSVVRPLHGEMSAISAPSPARVARQPSARALSRRGRLLASRTARPLTAAAPRPFASGLPDTSGFPFRVWAGLMARRWRRPASALVGYGDPAGYWPLRQAIASYVKAARAVRCEADQVVIVSGSQQALDLAARLLIDPGEEALVEDPCYPSARTALRAAGARIIRLPVDERGADIRRVRHPTPRVVFVTPSHQFPLGITMTLVRRLALLAWTKRSGAWILEDDYDSDFRYRGKPLPSLQGLDESGRVIYMGSFSKTMFPSLRLGFLVLPAALVEAFRRARTVIDGHSPVTEQAALADFITDGHFARHIRRMRGLYQERQAVLVEAARGLAGRLDVQPADGGMHLVGWLAPGVGDVETSQRAKVHGVYASPFSTCTIAKASRGGLLLGYAPFTPAQIREGVKRLDKALK